MMVGIKVLADVLTGIRFLLGLVLVWLGWRMGPEAMPTATLALFAAWVSDLLDGPLARRDPRGVHTWIGDHDLEADLAVAGGLWVYLTLTGYVPPWLTTAYVLAGAAALWHWRSAHLAWGLQALPYGAMIWTACRTAPPYGLLLVAWIGVAIVVTWPRFPRRTVPEFLRGMRDLWQRS